MVKIPETSEIKSAKLYAFISHIRMKHSNTFQQIVSDIKSNNTMYEQIRLILCGKYDQLLPKTEYLDYARLCVEKYPKSEKYIYKIIDMLFE